MTEKGQEQGQPCWVVAGPFAARLGLSKSQSDVLTRCWWLLPCQALAFKAPSSRCEPTRKCHPLCHRAAAQVSEHRFGQVQEGPCFCRPWQSSGCKSEGAEPLLHFFCLTTAAASLEIKMFLSRNEALIVLVCLAHICTSVCSYSHEFLKCVGCGLGDFCCTPQTPAVINFWCYIENKKQSMVLATRVNFSWLLSCTVSIRVWHIK